MLSAASGARGKCVSPKKDMPVAARGEEEERTTATELLPASAASASSPVAGCGTNGGDAASASDKDAGKRPHGDECRNAQAVKEAAVAQKSDDAQPEPAAAKPAKGDVEAQGRDALAAADKADAGASPKRLLSNDAPPVLVIVGPSGVGKGTLVKRIFSTWPEAFGFSVSHTSRQPRPGESYGKEYFFCTREQFEELKNQGQFIETAEFSGNYYGTSFNAVDNVRRTGRICVLEIDMAGVMQLQQTPLARQAYFVFIRPPSLEELEARLRGRHTEKEEHIRKRLAAAKKELELSTQLHFDFYLTNDDLEEAWQSLESQLAKWYGSVFEAEAEMVEKKSKTEESHAKGGKA
ncbi:guanylate kinase family protein [Besnoitia besnoiti]|uniref:guanylate kinase n=1 Tax=Besnoitia besnoiti TaxID=94643 RepID=A0A2A9MH00_BESBE|nr:guanylate kinase family protein [Besnoitia besnoiti]PFH36434.1 guanylate kinase family protein [Besnoitia besnoiti]